MNPPFVEVICVTHITYYMNRLACLRGNIKIKKCLFIKELSLAVLWSDIVIGILFYVVGL